MLRKKSETFEKKLQQRNRALESFEEIANTYLKTSVPNAAQKVPQLAPKKNARAAAWIRYLPWVVAAVCLAIALYIFVSNSMFDIRIHVLNKSAAVSKRPAADAPGFTGGETFLVKGGQPSTPLIEKVTLQGEAFSASKIYSDEISLSNAGGQGAASYRIDFKEPLDLSGKEIGYAAKSAAAEARLVVVITDTENKAYRVEDDAVTKVSKEWHAYTVNLKPVKGTIDLTSIASIRFEFGSSTVGNPAHTTIFLKDVYLAKSKRLKWL